MNKDVFIVFCNSSQDNYEGNWDSDTYIDSVWADLEDAKIRLNVLANEYIEEQWYEYEAIPGTDYSENWVEDGLSVKYMPDSYSEMSFYIEKHALRSGRPEENKDLPVYYDIEPKRTTA